jgi:Holliday junction resolvase-like predicted endonuclease
VTELYAAMIGLLVGAAGAWVKAVLAIREKVGEELRARRLATYPAVWRESAVLSYWPPAKLTYEDLAALNLRLRAWYFTIGGLYLSENSRQRYGELKELICADLEHWGAVEVEGELGRERYSDLAKTCSAFRTALTEDLQTRRQRSVWWTLTRWRLHKKQEAAWKKRIDEVGGKDQATEAYRLGDMPLPPLDSPPVSD